MQRTIASDVGKVLRDLDSFAGDFDKFVKHLRFLAFHSETVRGDTEEGRMGEGYRVNDAKYLQQLCKKLGRRVKGVKLLVTWKCKDA
jgi:hypothetical protein